MKLYHPTIPGKTVDVPKDIADEWQAQGWRKTAPRIVGEKRPERFVPDQPGTVIKRTKKTTAAATATGHQGPANH